MILLLGLVAYVALQIGFVMWYYNKKQNNGK